MRTSFSTACFTHPLAAEQLPQFPVSRDCKERANVPGHLMKPLTSLRKL